MELLGRTPFYSELDGEQLPVWMWKADGEENPCELHEESTCDNSGILYGTDVGREPKFCARHFYQFVVNGDGKSNYKLIDRKDEVEEQKRQEAKRA